MSSEVTFWNRINKDTADGCWLWTASTYHDGYGQFYDETHTPWRAHRFAYTMTHGPIPDGLQCLHKCDNRRCCNPSHLFLGTNAENRQDSVAKGRHAYGSKHTSAKITESDVMAMHELRKSSRISCQKIADRFGICQAHCSDILNGRKWRHVYIALHGHQPIQKPTNSQKTHCPYGHPYSPENTYVQKKTGGRFCRTCLRRRASSITP